MLGVERNRSRVLHNRIKRNVGPKAEAALLSCVTSFSYSLSPSLIVNRRFVIRRGFLGSEISLREQYLGGSSLSGSSSRSVAWKIVVERELILAGTFFETHRGER